MATTRRPAPQPANVNFRDASTGQYVTERFAKRHPAITVREVDRPRAAKK